MSRSSRNFHERFLEDFANNLNQSEHVVLRTLYERSGGPITVDQISSVTTLSRHRIYAALMNLRRLKFVTTETGGRINREVASCRVGVSITGEGRTYMAHRP